MSFRLGLAARSTAMAAITVLMAALSAPASAHAPSGAIFTTLPDGSEVNFNIYPDKESVYLDGGPGPGAPQTAAGLDDGTYVFQVTDPSGKALLSTDPAGCRQFTVSNGVINAVVPTGCEHMTGVDQDHGATTVQLMPYLDTPNHGGEYKAWVVELGDFLTGCQEFGVQNGLEVVDCGYAGGNAHGFVGGHHKTDNFKVKGLPREIDTRFFDDSGNKLLGLGITWLDTLGGQNRKWSYYKPELSINGEAHVEAVEVGNHQIVVTDQPGCIVQDIYLTRSTPKSQHTSYVGFGAQIVWVRIMQKDTREETTYFVDVGCH